MALDGQWFATIEHDHDDEGRKVGNYWFDTEAVIPRKDGERPLD